MLVKKVVPNSSPEQTQTVPVSRVTLAYTLHTGEDVVVGPAVSISSLHLTFGNVLETKRSAELCRLTGRVYKYARKQSRSRHVNAGGLTSKCRNIVC